jgi:hypothetical protein
MKRNPEIDDRLRQVRPAEADGDASMPEGFATRVLAARALEQERTRAFTGTALAAAVLAVAVPGALWMRRPAAPPEPAFAAWLEMEQETPNPWE